MSSLTSGTDGSTASSTGTLGPQALAPVMATPHHLGRTVENYELGRTLGKGHFATVKHARNSTSGVAVALKIIEYSATSARQRDWMARELAALQTISHPNVLKMNRFAENVQWPHTDGRPREVLLVDLEFAPGGELIEYLMAGGAFPEHIARIYFRQLISAVQACHTHGIYHRDIKPENILVSHDFQLKLADFGLVNINPDGTLLHTHCGTASYQAPEILAQRPYHGEKFDVWSCGVVLFIMLMGNPPFQIATNRDWWFARVASGSYDRFWAAHQQTPDRPRPSAGAKALINSIFRADPQTRVGVDDILADEWFNTPSGQAEDDEAVATRFMLERKRAIDAENEAAKAQERSRKRKSSEVSNGTAVSPFEDARRVVYRSHDEANIAAQETIAKAQPNMPPVLGDGTAAVYQLFMGADSPASLLESLVMTLATQQPTETPVVDQEDFTVCATVGKFDEPGAVSLELQVLTLPDPKDAGIYCVEAHRLDGNHWDFQGLWSKVCSSLRASVAAEEEELTMDHQKEEQIETDPQKIIF